MVNAPLYFSGCSGSDYRGDVFDQGYKNAKISLRNILVKLSDIIKISFIVILKVYFRKRRRISWV